MFKSEHISEKVNKIKLLILDVDGVMTDGGMIFSENGDQQKKFNTKDGMGIIETIKSGAVDIGIISSGFTGGLVHKRAEMLGIKRCYVGRDSKLAVLESWIEEMGYTLDQVAIIGDDVNDLTVMRKVGFSACPSDAVELVKKQVDVILSLKGGQGCIREFIDNYLLPVPLGTI
jgi:YrbI family 3-deoxy-D-manno-octulosonate 8-phosphate phosphatase